MSFLIMPGTQKKRMSKSIRKFIRTQKARIRRHFLGVKKQEEMIKEMYNKIKPDTNTRI